MTTETAISIVDWQSESDLDSIRNSCDVFFKINALSLLWYCQPSTALFCAVILISRGKVHFSFIFCFMPLPRYVFFPFDIKQNCFLHYVLLLCIIACSNFSQGPCNPFCLLPRASEPGKLFNSYLLLKPVKPALQMLLCCQRTNEPENTRVLFSKPLCFFRK